jgi:hypothetical protein
LSDHKHACLVYVAATASSRGAVKARLEQEGYLVCEEKAELEDALAAHQGNKDHLPAALAECISAADLCVFLLPEGQADDGVLDEAASLANQLGKRIVGIVAGTRDRYPEPFDDHAHSMVREDSDRLDDAICGSEVWERPDRSPVGDRPIKHIRCQ